MIRLKLQRHASQPDFMHGDLGLAGHFACNTIEDELREVKVAAETAIPAGSYRLELHWSPKFSPRLGRRVLRLIGAPNFTDVLIHPGNRDEDTAGCILPGLRGDPTKNWVAQSTAAFVNLMEVVEPYFAAGHEVWIDITNAPGARYVDSGNPAPVA